MKNIQVSLSELLKENQQEWGRGGGGLNYSPTQMRVNKCRRKIYYKGLQKGKQNTYTLVIKNTKAV